MVKPCDDTTKGRGDVHRVPHDCGRCVCGIRLFYQTISKRLGHGSQDLGIKAGPMGSGFVANGRPAFKA